MAKFQMANGIAGTTAAPIATSTGTAIKTHLQVLTPATMDMWILAWGISFDGVSSANAPIKCELLTTAAIAATVTIQTIASITLLDSASAPASQVTLSTSGTGFNASAEGTVAVARLADLQYVSPTSGYSNEFADGREFYVPVSTVLRIRTTAANTANCYCWVKWRE